jgi:hypothetical protein
MPIIEYEQLLVESAVFLAVRRDGRLECEFHLAIDPLYEIPDEELRQRHFGPIFREFFTKLKMDRLIDALMAERPLIGDCVDRCVVREAGRAKDESAELFVQSDGDQIAKRNMVVQICPQSFIESARFVRLMRRDLLHIADMLEERFGYERAEFSGPLSQQNLQRDRYRVLWDAYVESRLYREGRAGDTELARLERSFDRVFANVSPMPDAGVFRRVFDAPVLTHRTLMHWACEPESLFGTGRAALTEGALPLGA